MDEPRQQNDEGVTKKSEPRRMLNEKQVLRIVPVGPHYSLSYGKSKQVSELDLH